MVKAWAWLPKHLLDLISEKLIPLSDFVRFSAVCVEWRAVAMDQKERRMKNCHTQLPMLMIPTKDNSEERRSLYNIIERRIYDFQVPVPYNKRCCGSSHGWLITVESTTALTLINPFFSSSGSGIIRLPPVIEPEDLPNTEDIGMEYFIHKVILSADPALSPHDYVVVAIYSAHNRLALIKSGDESWTYIGDKRGTYKNNQPTLFSDVIYYKGQLHGVNHYSGIVSINISSGQLKTVVPSTNKYSNQTYLAESGGDLLLVQRTLARTDHTLQTMTTGFKVYRLLQHPSGRVEQVDVKNLGGDVLFLGDNHSMCLSASNFPGCQPNSIYYTDDYIDNSPYIPYGPRDTGIFNLEDGSFGQHHIPNPSQKHMPPPLWIVPRLQVY